MENHFELMQSGIKCDNSSCDFRDDTVKSEDYEQWVNKPCPKCGGNLLTEEDYNTSKLLEIMAGALNKLTFEEIEEMTKGVDLEKLKESEVFAGAKGLENLTNTDSRVNMLIDIHNGIRVEEIRKAE